MTIVTDERLQAIGTVFQGVRLVCVAPFRIDDDVAAYVCGICIGQTRLEGEFDHGDIIEFPIDYLPWVELPADIRLVNLRTGADICPPLPLKTHEQAIALIGMGEVEVENLSIDQGMMRGLAINRVNGLIRPQMFARINGLVPRAISVEPPRLIDDGGASFQFAAQLHPSDLGENGLTAEIFLVGKDMPLAMIAYRRADVDDSSKRIIELEAQLAQIKTSMAFKFNTLNSDVTARMDAIQQRIDTFIEYSSSFMFDKVAATEVPTQAGVEALEAARQEKVEAFLEIVHNAGGARKPENDEASQSTIVPLALRSTEFSYGWYDVEEDGGVEYRWMAADAIIFNPHPERKVREVRISLATIFGSDRPMMRAAFDTKPGTVTVARGDRSRRGTFLLRIVPAVDAEGVLCQTLNLASLLAGSPAHSSGSTDSRMLSVAVSQVTFEYAE